MTVSTDLSLISLPFLYYGGWGEELIEFPFSVPLFVQYSIGIIGILIAALSVVAWRSELKWEQENDSGK